VPERLVIGLDELKRDAGRAGLLDLGVSHARCNVRVAARLGNERMREKRTLEGAEELAARVEGW